LPGNFVQSNTYSEEKSAQIELEIKRFTDAAHQVVKKNLSNRRKALEKLAHLLSEKESVNKDELRRMLAVTKREMVTSSPEGDLHPEIQTRGQFRDHYSA
jgi:ATP-dependent Zn protease